MGKIIIDPVNRMEGHTGIEANTVGAESNGVRISLAEVHGNLFRGFERILIGRDPRDAMVICQRICGVCPSDHGVAASNNIGTLYGYKVHHEDPNSSTPNLVSQASTALPSNAARLRNLIHAAQHLMSHITHFYHLVALDYVNPNVLLGGIPTQLKRPFLCPRYDDNYYISNARLGALVPILASFPAYGPALGVLTGLPGAGGDLAGAINAYLTGQYLKALDMRRIAHQMMAIFAGRGPHASCWTPGGVTATVDSASINKYQSLLNQLKAFVGEPTDFLTGTAGTWMFDVVAAAHVFPEYFWIGNSWQHFQSFGWAEEAGAIPLTGDFGVLFPGGINNPDQRAFRRGYKLSAQAGAPWNALDILHIGESIASSRYTKSGVNYPSGHAFEHPWAGQTNPDPNQTYSWLKSPRYNIGGTVSGTQIVGGTWNVMEVGPLSRLVVNGTYWGGMLNGQGTALGVNGLYPIAPVWGQAGPDCATGADPLGAALKPVYATLLPANGGPNLSAVAYNGDSTLDRIAARTIESRIFIDQAQKILNDLSGTVGGNGYGPSGCTDRFGEEVPVRSQIYRGYGMTEASRGCLSHWVTLQNGKITSYQAVVPTTWNASPRDANGNPGPTEKSLENNGGVWIADANQPIEVIRTIHSYDFCIACAVHLVTPKGDVVKVDVPALPG